VVFLLHPALGAVAAGGAALLLAPALLNEAATAPALRRVNTAAALAAQRRAEGAFRDAEAIEAMGMLPAVLGRWREAAAECAAPQSRAADARRRCWRRPSSTAPEAERARRWALLAQDARLAAEGDGAGAVAFPAELLASPEPRAMDAVAGQRAPFEARRTVLDSRALVLRARVEQQEAAIAGFRGQLDHFAGWLGRL
jgi:ABC-type protease/lipase transport system fused ATPase/permease subunit